MDHPRQQSPRPPIDPAVAATEALTCWLGSGAAGAEGMRTFRAAAPQHQQAAVDAMSEAVLERVIAAGWTPLDLQEWARRNPGPAVPHLFELLTTATRRHPPSRVHPQWQAQLDQLGASPPGVPGRSRAHDWGRRSGYDWPSTVFVLVPMLSRLLALPRIEQVLPPPGAHTGVDGGSDVDDRVLRRVRGLLAKAESTEHAGEADALSAKAQELMSRYSIDRALAESAGPTGAQVSFRRLWLENPYLDGKAALIGQVAGANHCRAVQVPSWGYLTVVGHDADIDLVELLATSLLVQATRAMTVAGSQISRDGTSRTRSFRRSFLLSYAARIGERLRDSARTAETSYDARALVPVLAARRAAVQDTVEQSFPHLVERRMSATNPAGWGAGRAAADLAQLDVRTSVRSRAG